MSQKKLCECKCNFNGRKCNSNQKWSNDKCWCECKNLEEYHVCKKDYVWNPVTCTCENGRYLRSIIDELGITCNEIINAAESVSTNLSKDVMSAVSTNVMSDA